jgi:SOS-response transcriptional repressor LexA
MPEVSDVARRLKAMRERAGLSMRAVADSLGWPLTRYQHYEDRYRRTYLPVDLIRHLVGLFQARGIDPREVLGLAGVETLLPGDSPPLPAAAAAPPPPPVPIGRPVRDLPVIGAVKGGAEGFYFNEGDPKEYVERPAALAGVANGFALYVDGDSMEPRYFAGEILYVNPNRPISRNCFVAVELRDGQGLIKQFVRRTDDHVFLRQFNPAKDLRLPVRDVKRMYRITGSGEA